MNFSGHEDLKTCVLCVLCVIDIDFLIPSNNLRPFLLQSNKKDIHNDF